MRRSPLVVALALSIAGCQDSSAPSAPDGPSFGASAPVAQAIANRYIVVFRPGTVADIEARSRALAAGEHSTPDRVFHAAIEGFVADMTPEAAARLRARGEVAMVEQDRVIQLDATQTPTPSWGLDRIDQLTGLNNSYTYATTGAGVRLYSIDTGILPSHSDFGGRASIGFDAFGGNGMDCNGHGTHTASTAAGGTYGVAKSMTIIAVRVLDCQGFGSTSGVIAGIDWVTQNGIKPAVANMSLGGSFSAALNAAVANSVASGVVYAVAAGNSGANACNESPSSEPTAITVGSTTTTDARSSFSNFGNCLDLFAPGSGITAAWIGSNSATNTISGTSMASPHVAGAAGLYLETNPTATPATVAAALTGNASNGVVTSPGSGSPNKLLNVSFIGGPPPGPNNPPVANWSWSCTANRLCTFNGTASTDDHGITSYVWQIGSRPPASGAMVSFQWYFNVTIPASLTVTDANGASHTLSATITIAPNASGSGGGPPPNQPPTAQITAPPNGTSVVQGSNVTFTGSGSDPETGALTGAALTWTSSINGQIGSGTTFSTTTLAVGTHTITLTARDPQNATGTASIALTVTAPPPGGNPPVANWTWSCTPQRWCTFDGRSSTDDQGIVSYVWVIGLRPPANGAVVSYQWYDSRTISVTLTVTDAQGLTNSLQRNVTIP